MGFGVDFQIADWFGCLVGWWVGFSTWVLSLFLLFTVQLCSFGVCIAMGGLGFLVGCGFEFGCTPILWVWL